MLNFQGNEVRITYTGKDADNETKFTREVGEFAKEELVAKREAPPRNTAFNQRNFPEPLFPLTSKPHDRNRNTLLAP
jgi:hypothetical protein